jgi:hypothetical protein
MNFALSRTSETLAVFMLTLFESFVDHGEVRSGRWRRYQDRGHPACASLDVLEQAERIAAIDKRAEKRIRANESFGRRQPQPDIFRNKASVRTSEVMEEAGQWPISLFRATNCILPRRSSVALRLWRAA